MVLKFSLFSDTLLERSTVCAIPASVLVKLATADDEVDYPELPECARRLIELGCEYVLITGTHENTAQVLNILYGSEGVVRSDAWQRLSGSFHGTGCTLAAAVAATLANGLSIPEAVRDAQEFTWQSLKAAFRPGMGQQIPDRLFWARATEGDDETGTAA